MQHTCEYSAYTCRNFDCLTTDLFPTNAMNGIYELKKYESTEAEFFSSARSVFTSEDDNFGNFVPTAFPRSEWTREAVHSTT